MIGPSARGPDGQPYLHLVVTRYNVGMGSAHAQGIYGLDPDWLTHRGKLFRRYCVPSIGQQTNRSFTWVVIFHPSTPPEHYRFLEGIAHVVFDRSGASGIRRIGAGIVRGFTPVLSTRLDNDDGIASDFVERMQQEIAARTGPFFREQRDFVITYPYGIAFDLELGAGYRFSRSQNSFLGLMEFIRADKPWQSAFSFNHMKAHSHHPVVDIADSRPAWLMTIHDRNIVNRNKLEWFRSNGVRCDLEALAPRFSGLVEIQQGVEKVVRHTGATAGLPPTRSGAGVQKADVKKTKNVPPS